MISTISESPEAPSADVVPGLYTGAIVKDRCNITPAEFEIIEILWEQGSPRSVGQVTKMLRTRRSVAYTTVMTLLDKMARKGSLERVKRGKAYYYSPSVRRSQVLRFLLQEFTNTYWRGNVGQLSRFIAEMPGGRQPRQDRKPASGTHYSSREAENSESDSEDMDIVLL